MEDEMKKKHVFLFFICNLCQTFSAETSNYIWNENYNQGLRNRYSRVDSFLEGYNKKEDSCHRDQDKLMESAKKSKDSEKDEVFSCLGKGFVLFKQKKYEEAFNHIYLLSMRRDYAAQYLLGTFYEYGLGNIHKNINSAYNLYVSAYCNSSDDYLIYLADAGISRTIKYIKFNKELESK
jgi:TPR repeat protein